MAKVQNISMKYPHLNLKEVIKLDNQMVLTIAQDGTKRWVTNEGIRHREDGPSIEYPDGEKRWFKNDNLHRENGPAIDGPNWKMWYLYGLRHREDGPAVEDINGTKHWYFHGKFITVSSQKEFEQWLKYKAFI